MGKGLDLDGEKKSANNELTAIEVARKRSMFKPIDSSADDDITERQRIENLHPIKQGEKTQSQVTIRAIVSMD